MIVFVSGASPPYARWRFRCTVLNDFVSVYHTTTFTHCWEVAIVLATVTPHEKLSSLMRSCILLLVTVTPQNSRSDKFKVTEYNFLGCYFICYKFQCSSFYSFSAAVDWNVRGSEGISCITGVRNLNLSFFIVITMARYDRSLREWLIALVGEG
jgi:hypothetical protein